MHQPHVQPCSCPLVATSSPLGVPGPHYGRYLLNNVALTTIGSDGLHLTTEGYGIFWDEYTKLVKNEFKGRGLDWEDPVDCPELVPS